MITINIPPGKLIQVTTIGDKKNLNIAPSLTFGGKLLAVDDKYIEIGYVGNKVVQNVNGKVIGSEKGDRVQRIYRSTIASVGLLSW